jgi:negative regulator of sigma E activity
MISPTTVAVATVVAVAVSLGPAAAWAGDGPLETEDWRAVVAFAAEAARERQYRGEVVWATWEGDRPSVTLVQVAHANGRVALQVGAGSGSATQDGQAETAGGMPTGVPDAHMGVARVPDAGRLAEKYDVSGPTTSRMLERRCALIEIRDRASQQLRERLWVDAGTGILLRREAYEGGELLRLAAFIALEEAPSRPVGRSPAALGEEVPEPPPPVDAGGVEALRAAGWTIPDQLPGGYRLEAVYAHAGGAGPPLQTVYGDGLYTVSLFEQRGTPDWETLPNGARPVDRFASRAYEWPGSVPRRVVWSGQEATFTLVGDPPPAEFRAIVDALPQAPDRTWFGRVLDTVGRWWGRVTG